MYICSKYLKKKWLSVRPAVYHSFCIYVNFPLCHEFLHRAVETEANVQ